MELYLTKDKPLLNRASSIVLSFLKKLFIFCLSFLPGNNSIPLLTSIPFGLIVFMASDILFIFNPQTVQRNSQSPRVVYQKIGLSFVSTYGGYFNGGLGLALLSALSIDKEFSLKQLSAIKSLLSLFITLVSVSIFFLSNFIAWSFVFYMMFFSILGGFTGAKLTEVLSNQLLRRFIILVGISLSISLFTLNYL